MKYDTLDLHELLPYGVPVNDGNSVKQTGYINNFFLNGFTTQFEVIKDFAQGCSAPYSLEATRICSDTILKRFIEEAGAEYYTVDHEILAQFTHSLYTIPLGSLAIVNALVQYACENNNVYSQIEPTGAPHVYDIAVSGDIVGSSITTDIVNRLEHNLNNLLPASEQWRGFNFTDEDEVPAHVAAAVLNVDEIDYINNTEEIRLGWFMNARGPKTTTAGGTNNLYNTFPGSGGLSKTILTLPAADRDVLHYQILSITYADGTTVEYNPEIVGELTLSITASGYLRVTTQRSLRNVLYLTIKHTHII